MNKNTISKATSPNPEPTSGWMLQVIAQMTKKDHQTCTQVVDYLILRLSVNNPYVKKKTLKVIRHCCESGDMNFAQTIAKKSEEVRHYATFKGKKDPLHGDALNQQVREEAKQAIDAIFRTVEGTHNGGMDYQLGSGGAIGNTASSSSSSTSTSATWGSYFGRGGNEPEKPVQHTGFGSGVGSNMLAASSSSSYNNPDNFNNQNQHTYGGGSMQGVGSSSGVSNVPQNQSKSWKEWGLEKLNILNNSGNKKMYAEHISQNFPSFMNQERRDYVPPTSNQFTASSSSYNNNNNHNNHYNIRQEEDAEEEIGNASAQWNDEGTPLNTDNSGSYEARLVDDICKPSVKKPSRSELNKFVKISEGVRSDVIASLLNTKLQHPKWKVKLNALYVIEALINSGNDKVATYFAQHSEWIQKSGEAVQSSVAKRATEILNALHPNENSQQQEEEDYHHPQQNNQSSLLDFVEEKEEMVDMFGGMKVKSKKRSTPKKKVSSSSSSSNTTNDILLDMIDTVSEEDRESARKTRQRSNSKTNILATLEHFMTPTTNTPTQQQQQQSPSAFTTTTRTVPYYTSPQQPSSQQPQQQQQQQSQQQQQQQQRIRMQQQKQYQQRIQMQQQQQQQQRQTIPPPTTRVPPPQTSQHPSIGYF